MRPEKLFELRQHLWKVEKHQKAAEVLRKENPGPPPADELLRPLDRYALVAEDVRSFINYEDEDFVFRDGKTERIVGGRTPVLPIQITHQGDTLELELSLTMVEDVEGAQANITAVWSDPARNPPSARWDFYMEEPMMLQDLEDESNDFIQGRLNNLEWSLLQYRDAALQQSPEDAEARGFPQEFVENLRHLPLDN